MKSGSRICMHAAFALAILYAADARAIPVGHQEILLTGAVSETFDDNITAVSSNHLYDFITTFMLGLGVRLTGKNSRFELAGHAYQQIYARSTGFSNTSADAELAWSLEPGPRDRLVLRNVFHYYLEPRAFEDAFGAGSRLSMYLRNRFDGSYAHTFSNSLELVLRYGNELFSRLAAPRDDSVLHLPGLVLAWSVTPRSSLFLFYDFTHRRFGELARGNRGPDAMIHTPGLGYRYSFRKNLGLELRGGLSIIESYDGQGAYVPAGSAALVYERNETTLLSILFAGEAATTPYGRNVSANWRISAIADQQFLKRLHMQGSLFYGEGRYLFMDLIYRFVGVQASLAYDCTPTVQAVAGYSFRWSDSDDNAGFSYCRNTVYIECRAGI